MTSVMIASQRIYDGPLDTTSTTSSKRSNIPPISRPTKKMVSYLGQRQKDQDLIPTQISTTIYANTPQLSLDIEMMLADVHEGIADTQIIGDNLTDTQHEL
jgi:hypothetical protein